MYALSPDGSLAAPPQTWRDPDADGDFNLWEVAEHAGEIVLVSSRQLDIAGPGDSFAAPLFRLVLAPDGTVVGEPRVLVPGRFVSGATGSAPFQFSLTWAGYSFAIAYSSVADDGISDTWVQRICPP